MKCTEDRGDGVTLPGGVQGITGQGTQCHDLFAALVFSLRLGSDLRDLFQPKCFCVTV